MGPDHGVAHCQHRGGHLEEEGPGARDHRPHGGEGRDRADALRGRDAGQGHAGALRLHKLRGLAVVAPGRPLQKPSLRDDGFADTRGEHRATARHPKEADFIFNKQEYNYINLFFKYILY